MLVCSSHLIIEYLSKNVLTITDLPFVVLIRIAIFFLYSYCFYCYHACHIKGGSLSKPEMGKRVMTCKY